MQKSTGSTQWVHPKKKKIGVSEKKRYYEEEETTTEVMRQVHGTERPEVLE